MGDFPVSPVCLPGLSLFPPLGLITRPVIVEFPPWRRLMKFVSLLLALWLQVPATTNPPTIDDVQVRGNRRQQNSSASLKYIIQSKRGDTINRALVARDIRAIYAREQFDNVWAETEETTPCLLYTSP